ncbi:DUF3667 domain-containing protein [Gammaproteobacteria bacterium AH-315-E17]|nr:DUF3667 domain-containing protein [Gammaproteobacteria bacterium AH-315-E17]
MLPLLFKPGKLTNEYIAGRRVRYLPPFRLYLIFSILFFLVAAIPDFTGFDNLSAEDREGLTQDLQEARDEFTQGLQEAGVINTENNIGITSPFNSPADFPEEITTLEPIENNSSDNISLTDADDCIDVPWSGFLGERLGGRALSSCQTAFSDNGVTLMQSFIDYLPVMMFVCVPLLAVFMKVLYLFKNRKYIEHLMFLFHTHSFIFLVVILNVSIIKISGPFPIVENSIAPLVATLWIYAVIYIFIALKKVYRQNFFMTSFKMIMLFPSYSICLALSFASGLFLTFITI